MNAPVAAPRRPAAAPLLSAGVITADLTRLGAEMDVIRGRATWAHVDVMDGSFCPQLTVGPAFIKAVVSTGVPVDAHLMVTDPVRFLPDVVRAGAAIVTVHAESGRHPHRALTELTRLSREVRPVIRGYAINPGTPVQAVEPVLELIDLVLVLAVSPGWSGQVPAANTARRIAAVRELTRDARRPILIGVDGGVTLSNAAEVAGWGADVVVSGSAIFDGGNAPANLAAMLAALAAASSASLAAASSASAEPVPVPVPRTGGTP
jgi:ribulose-phosphate 3-epimerase